MAWDGVNLSDLNGFMKNYSSGVIIPEVFTWNSLYDALKGNVSKTNFNGDQVEQLIQTTMPYTATAFGENVDIPYPQTLGFVRQYIPLKQIIANAGLTKQALDRANGGINSWGNVVDTVLKAQRQEFMWFMELSSIGDGTGRLARSSGAGVYNGSSTLSSTGKDITITCDNTYADFGWENVALIKKGMWVEAYLANGTQSAESAVTAWKVCNVTFGNRNNGAATTGTIVIEVGSDINAQFDDGTVLYLAGTRSSAVTDSVVAFGATSANGNPGTVYEATNMQGSVDVHTSLPMGLVGLIQSTTAGRTYTDSAIDCTLDTFQGLARASYPTQNANVYQGADFDGTDGTPSDWDLSVISDVISQIDDDTGGKVDMLECSSQLAMAIHRRNRTESNITVNVSSTGNQNQNAVGAQFAGSFLCPDGRVIPIKVSKTVPRNVLYCLTTEDMQWHTKGDFDFLRLNGEIWDKSYNDRKANFEAPFGGYSQLGAKRVDRCACIQDLADNI